MVRYTNVRGYKDRELIDRVKHLKSFSHIPDNYWLLGVQSNEDSFNKFDDKFYLFKGEDFIKVFSGTTNAGKAGLKNYERYNKNGTFVIKTDEWYYDLWKFGYHRGKMEALRQVSAIKGYRDNNKNDKAEEIGRVVSGYYGINFHTVTYGRPKSFWRRLIGGWSVGCQVANDYTDYRSVIDLVKGQDRVTYCIIKEF
jgi:hypothetical protein